ncbi:hypothetical protein LV89_00495 [Arcicella aurantiaca]|uniref:Uncharacterized protein n=1 Tax=Arcicella aurantiaca TaxID=591202 RepID=A0A316EFB2_9BACT|nr:hypothetical protein LV89_00495 [Arcicella aurantiaca]
MACKGTTILLICNNFLKYNFKNYNSTHFLGANYLCYYEEATLENRYINGDFVYLLYHYFINEKRGFFQVGQMFISRKILTLIIRKV